MKNQRSLLDTIKHVRTLFPNKEQWDAISIDKRSDFMYYLLLPFDNNWEVYDLFGKGYEIITNKSYYISGTDFSVSHSEMIKIFDTSIKFAKNWVFA